MPEQTSATLPDNPNLEWLRKQAKDHRAELRKVNPAATLADAQFDLAKRYGFSNWRALKAHVDSLTIDGQIIEAARTGNVETLRRLLDEHPDKLHVKVPPYEASLLFPAAQNGSLEAVDLLLARGLDVNYREKGDNTYALHWVAAQGNLAMARKLVDAGGDVVGDGDDHAGGVIGWATGWDGCDDEAHHAVVDLLISRGARHHIFSAVAMNLADEVRQIVAAHPAALNQRQSRNENHQTPLHFAVRMKRPAMVQLLLDLGADPLTVDGSGMPVAGYATDPTIDLPVMKRIREMTLGELDSARRGRRAPNVGMLDLLAAVTLRDWPTASSVGAANRRVIEQGGVLHVLAKRGDAAGVRWLLEHGAQPNTMWAHWDAEVTPLHLAAMSGFADVAGLLIDAGADPTIRDSQHDGNALGWAYFFKKPDVVRLLKDRGYGMH
jgi:ankyrin repeat protein